jgi:hypothetical protein
MAGYLSKIPGFKAVAAGRRTFSAPMAYVALLVD